MRRLLPPLAFALTLQGAAGTLAAQRPAASGDRKPCEMLVEADERPGDTTSYRMVTSGSGGRISYIGGGVTATCVGQGNRLYADSAQHFEESGLLVLYRNVRYTEARVRIRSDSMRYFMADERLLAEGNVRGTTASGTRFAGPRMEYFRDKPGLRTASRWVATGRPFVRMSPTADGSAPTVRRDSAGAVVSDSVDLTANTVLSENDSLVWAGGNVIIERWDMRATGDSATLDQGTGHSRLMRTPRIVGRGERAFTLDGTLIDLWSKERQLERVLASGNGKVLSDSLTLTADTIDLRLAAQRMERVFAWGGRARADAPAQRIDADSLDIRMPGQRLREMHAVGSARATSRPDTLRIVTEEPDWIAGDTIVATFDSTAVADSTSQPRMREVVATGGARSFYQMAPNDSLKGLPTISYNKGRVITVAFEEGEMQRVEVLERASGIFLEPVRTSPASARADTTRAPTRPAPTRRP